MTAASGADGECDGCGQVGGHWENCGIYRNCRDGGHLQLFQYLDGSSHCLCHREQQPASAADQPTLRDQLAGALAEAHGYHPAAATEGTGWMKLVDALLPVIEADRERAKAVAAVEALEGAAYAIGREAGYCYGAQGGVKANAFNHAAELVRDRAAALRGSTGGGT